MKNLKRKSICFVIGTRPELIKQLPVYYECVKIFGKAKTLLINSGQHRNFLDFYIKEKNIKFDLTVKKNESTSSLKKNLLNYIDNLIIIYYTTFSTFLNFDLFCKTNTLLPLEKFH